MPRRATTNKNTGCPMMLATPRTIRSLPLLVLLAALFPAQLWAGGFYTAPANPVYNLGPESAWMNPAGMTGVKTATVAASVGGILPVFKFNPSVAQAGGTDGGNSGVNGFLPNFYAVVPATDDLRFGFSMLSPFGAVDDSVRWLPRRGCSCWRAPCFSAPCRS